MDTITSTGQQSSESGAQDIMSAFDIPNEGSQTQASGNGSSEGTAVQQQAQQLTPYEKFRQAGQAQQEQPDEKSFQSKYDKLYSEHTLIQQQMEEYKKASLFLNEIMSDESVKRAFIAEIAPDLIKTTNIHDMVKETLLKEFGEGFEFDPEEAKKGYGEHFWYQERSRELYHELRKGGTEKTLTLKEIREKQKVQKEAEAQEKVKLVARLKGEFHTDDETITNFFQWAQKLEPTQLFKMYNYALRQQRKPSPSLAAQNGQGQMLTEREAFLKNF